MSSTDKPLLFFSNKCQYCSALVQRILSLNLINKFVLICIDHRLDKIPRYIRQVPALIESGKIEPIFGTEVFNFIDRVKMQNMPQSSIEPYSELEHGGTRLTDRFSYLSGIESHMPPSSSTPPRHFKQVDPGEKKDLVMQPKENVQVPMREFLGEPRPLMVDMRPKPSSDHPKNDPDRLDRFSLTIPGTSKPEQSRKDGLMKKYEELQKEREQINPVMRPS